ncbi:hypothetical protein BDY24DRAFT_439763 [Mrakia frigida]|uniref:uncharacterized protein n=1 Tax=Mrakia frigida TaxID=29902 RepID=UPI003FCC222E
MLKFVRYIYIDFDWLDSEHLLRLILLLQSLLNRIPSLLHLSFNATQPSHHGTSECDLTFFVLPAHLLLPNLLSLELAVPCNRCCSHLLLSFKRCPRLSHLKVTEDVYKSGARTPASYLGSDDPQLFPPGLRVLFVNLAKRPGPRTDILKRLPTNCPLLEDLRLHCAHSFKSTRVAPTVPFQASNLVRCARLLRAFEHLHTVDIDDVLLKTSRWSPSPSELADVSYETGNNVLERAWKDYVHSSEVYMSEVVMEVLEEVPTLERFWCNNHTERLDGAEVAPAARYQRHELKLEDGVFRIVQVRDRAAYSRLPQGRPRGSLLIAIIADGPTHRRVLEGRV